MRLLLIFALSFTLSAQQKNGSEMIKKIMNAIGEDGRDQVINSLDEYDVQKLMDCMENECEMEDFVSLKKKIIPILKKANSKGLSKLMSMLINDGDIKQSSNGNGGGGMMALPYYETVPDGLRPGMSIYVNGTVSRNPNRFWVDFAFEKHEGPNIPFHFNPRFNRRKVVLNTFESGWWGKEEKHKNPFQEGKHFEIIFIVNEAGYQILVNRKLFCGFRHRIPPQSVQVIKVDGDLELQSLTVKKGPMMGDMITAFPEIYDPALPYEQPVLGGLRPGMSVHVEGTVPEDSNKFWVDFACCQHRGADIPFHFKPCFDFENLVLNTLQSHRWGTEEKYKNPLSKGEHFKVIFIVTETEYQILVNGNPFCNFSHRFPPQGVQLIRVDGDLELQSLNVTAGTKTGNTVMMPPAIYNPPVPYIGDIPGGLGASRTITVRGSIPSNAKRFEISFMAGQDIPLHINLRMKPWKAVVRNSFLNGSWGQEERNLTFNPFQPGQHFKLSIHCDHHEFKFYANDQPFFDYTHRYVPIKHIRTLEIDGDVTLSYIKYEAIEEGSQQ